MTALLAFDGLSKDWFGVPAVTVPPEEVGDALRRALAATGPNVVVVPTRLRMFAPTHLDR